MEDVNFSMMELHSSQKEVSIIFYMQNIFPGRYKSWYFFKSHFFFSLEHTFNNFIFLLDEWENFLERMNCESLEGLKEEGKEEELRNWASYRGQTLSRTGEGNRF